MSNEKKEYPHFFKNSPTLGAGPLIKHINKMELADANKKNMDQRRVGRLKRQCLKLETIEEMSFDLVFTDAHDRAIKK